MRCLKLLAAILFTTSIAGAQEPAPPAQETVKFDGQTLALASRNSSGGESLKEYIPAGEKLDAWSKLAAIHVFPGMDDPLTAATLQAQLKKQYPDAPSRIIKDSTTGDAIIDL